MVVIRLTRVGKKNSPAYRVVVAEKRRAVKRKFIEVIGHYNPILKPKEVVISRERALFWLKAGAQPSDTVRNLMADLEIISKKEKVNIKYAKDKKKKELKAEAGAKPEAPAATDAAPEQEKTEDLAKASDQKNEEASESKEEVAEKIEEENKEEAVKEDKEEKGDTKEEEKESN